MSDLSIRYLIQKHREIEISLKEIDALLDDPKLSAESATSRTRVQRVIGKFSSKVNGLIRAKEEVLFPALEGVLSSETGPLAVLRSEHAILRALLGSMLAYAESTEADDYAPEWERFRNDTKSAASILRNQIYKEGRVFFPMVTRMISPEEDAILAERMSHIDGNRPPRLRAKTNGSGDARIAAESNFIPPALPRAAAS